MAIGPTYVWKRIAVWSKARSWVDFYFVSCLCSYLSVPVCPWIVIGLTYVPAGYLLIEKEGICGKDSCGLSFINHIYFNLFLWNFRLFSFLMWCLAQDATKDITIPISCFWAYLELSRTTYPFALEMAIGPTYVWKRMPFDWRKGNWGKALHGFSYKPYLFIFVFLWNVTLFIFYVSCNG